jgi:Peptidase family M1 domain
MFTLRLLSILLLACCVAHAQPGKTAKPADGSPVRFADLYNDLMGLAASPTHVATISNITLKRDVATFNLTSGKLYLCKPVAGRVCAALFIGEGNYSYAPPSNVERAQLRRFYQKDSLHESFRSMFLLFADSTAEELGRLAKFGAGELPPECGKGIEDALYYVSSKEYRYFDDEFMNALLNGERSDLFYTQINPASGDPIFFEINPYVESYMGERVSFMRKGQHHISSSFREVVNQFPRRDAGEEEGDVRVKIDRYAIDFALSSDLDVNATATITLRPKENVRWFNLHLYPELRIDSMVWGNGTPAEFHQTRTQTIWVKNDPAAVTGGSATLNVRYRGKILARESDWVLLQSSTGWYPLHDAKNKALFDLTFHFPDNFKLASIGTMVSSQENDDVVTSHWVIDRPVRNASFGVGIFSAQEFAADSAPPVTVYRGPSSSGGVSEQIGWDVQHSLKFYEYLFGKLPVERFFATEIPAGHGEAFPGLIHLSVSTFDRNDQSGRHEIFRAHEVAHQWWGIAVDFKTYHDQWLSEGFSEYAGLMYMQAVLKDNDKFFRRLDEYRKEILGNRKSIFGSGQEAGPIWLGWRTSSSSTAGDYDLIIYKKGAWVLHMLRNMMLDLNSMKEDKYRTMMRAFYSMYQGGEATTDDFRRMVEKHAGMPMDWFFRQWVYGTDVPTYKYAFNVQDAGNGKFKLAMKVDQENVPADFQMYVPLKIDFGDNRFAWLRVLVKGAHCEPELPLMPLKPKKITFNALESVLCESEEVDWD